MMVVEVRSKLKASGRTKTRVKQNGPLFEILDNKVQNPPITDRVLLKSKKTGWFGWLPKDEIVTTEWEGF